MCTLFFDSVDVGSKEEQIGTMIFLVLVQKTGSAELHLILWMLSVFKHARHGWIPTVLRHGIPLLGWVVWDPKISWEWNLVGPFSKANLKAPLFFFSISFVKSCFRIRFASFGSQSI